jgi:RNA polymerase sigma factor (sigma-70 family)
MRDSSDMELLGEYARQHSEAAFAELVQRHIALVYSAAHRHSGVAAHAEEITQAVFIILARKAGSLRPGAVLDAWLYETTRFTALSFLRAERRRQFREQEAYMQSTLHEPATDPVWPQIAPLLDEAMMRLGHKEREAIVLRFFKGKTLREVAAGLDISEAAAQKRVNRALEALHSYFSKHGISSTTAILAGAISANSLQMAPPALAKTVAAIAAAKGAAASTSTLTLIKGTLKIMAWTKAKTAVVVAVGMMLAAGTSVVAIKAVHPHGQKVNASRAATLFKDFIAAQKAQAEAAAAANGKSLPHQYAAFFAAAENGDWPAMLNTEPGAPAPDMAAPAESARAVLYAFQMFSLWDEKYASVYGRDILDSIPPGSVYFTGVPMGGELIPALQESQPAADPRLMVSLFRLSDSSYRTYLRSAYGGKIDLPTEADAEKCYGDYAPDAWARNQHNQLQRQDFQRIGMLIGKFIFEKNPGRDFYYEEAGPVEWMYPHLEPHGLILKINRQPLAALSEDTVAQDRTYWAKQLQPMIGNWLTEDTSVAELVAWTERVRLKHDFSGFTGDRSFIGNTNGEQQIYSKLRNAIGGVYAWRADHAADPAEKERMTREADFAFRQALALWPCSPESCSPVLRYAALLKKEKRNSDAGLIQNLARQCAKQVKR